VAAAAAPRVDLCGCRLRAWSSRSQRSPAGLPSRVLSARARTAARAALLHPLGGLRAASLPCTPCAAHCCRCALCRCPFSLTCHRRGCTPCQSCVPPCSVVLLGAIGGHCLELTSTIRARCTRPSGLFGSHWVHGLLPPVGPRLVLTRSPRWCVPSTVRPRPELSAAAQRFS
jgi:hypothetical protein